MTLQSLPTMSLLGPAPPHFFQPHAHLPWGPWALGQEPTFLGPRWGWLLQAADISHIPPQGQVPSLHWFLNVTASHSPH